MNAVVHNYMKEGREARFTPQGSGFVVHGNWPGELPFSADTQAEAEDIAQLWAMYNVNPYQRKTLTQLVPVEVAS